MTFIGKLLAVINLIVGVGVVTWSVSAYAQRPGWFTPLSEDDKSLPPERLADRRYENFATLKAETDALAKTANVASGSWGDALKSLEQVEDVREKRRAEFARRIAWAHKGNPKDKDKAAFFATVYEKDATGKESASIDITTVGKAIPGPDDRPLKGVDDLLANVSADTKEIERLALQIAEHRKQYAEISSEIVDFDNRLMKMIVIREAALAERFHLDTFEVNVYETRETVLRRLRQLKLRLTELGVGKP